MTTRIRDKKKTAAQAAGAALIALASFWAGGGTDQPGSEDVLMVLADPVEDVLKNIPNESWTSEDCQEVIDNLVLFYNRVQQDGRLTPELQGYIDAYNARLIELRDLARMVEAEDG